jgi:hypothetical protein
MADAPEGRVVHLTRKRVRIKVAARRHDSSFFRTAREQLAGRAAVESVEVNPATGSILIHCPDSRALIDELQHSGMLVLVEPTPEREAPPSLEQFRQQFTDWNKQIQYWTGTKADARVYLFFALVLGAVYQFARGNVFAPAATLIWYASEALRVWTPRNHPQSQGSGDTEA